MNWRCSKSSVPRPVTYTGRGSENGERSTHKIGETHRVPSFGGGKSLGLAARVCPSYDVIEALQAVVIQPWIEEAEGRPALRKLVVIQQRDNARYNLYIYCQLDTEDGRTGYSGEEREEVTDRRRDSCA